MKEAHAFGLDQQQIEDSVAACHWVNIRQEFTISDEKAATENAIPDAMEPRLIVSARLQKEPRLYKVFGDWIP